jgi:hypothetical protein
MPVSKDEEYRNNAFDSLRLAERAVSLVDKLRLLHLAELWVDLADRVDATPLRLRIAPSSDVDPPQVARESAP